MPKRADLWERQRPNVWVIRYCDLPPSVNDLYEVRVIRGKFAGFYMAPAAAEWKRTASLVAHQAGLRPQKGKAWTVSMWVFLPNDRRDGDNCVKVLQDAVIGKDHDQRVLNLHVYRRDAPPGSEGWCTVRVIEVDDARTAIGNGTAVGASGRVRGGAGASPGGERPVVPADHRAEVGSSGA